MNFKRNSNAFQTQVPCFLLLFLLVSALMTVAFLSYQLYGVAIGTTTYESFRWKDLRRRMEAEARGEGAPNGSGAAGSGSGSGSGSGDGSGAAGGSGGSGSGQGVKAAAQKPHSSGQQGQGQQRAQAEPGGSGYCAACAGSTCSSAQAAAPRQGGWLARLRAAVGWARRPRVRVQLPPNIYDRGLAANFSEVFFPAAALRRASQPVERAAAAGGQRSSTPSDRKRSGKKAQ